MKKAMAKFAERFHPDDAVEYAYGLHHGITRPAESLWLMIGELCTAAIGGRLFLALDASHGGGIQTGPLHFDIVLEKPKGVRNSNVAGKNVAGNSSHRLP
jgi:hypothetical protein